MEPPTSDFSWPFHFCGLDPIHNNHWSGEGLASLLSHRGKSSIGFGSVNMFFTHKNVFHAAKKNRHAAVCCMDETLISNFRFHRVDKHQVGPSRRPRVPASQRRLHLALCIAGGQHKTCCGRSKGLHSCWDVSCAARVVFDGKWPRDNWDKLYICRSWSDDIWCTYQIWYKIYTKSDRPYCTMMIFHSNFVMSQGYSALIRHWKNIAHPS